MNHLASFFISIDLFYLILYFLKLLFTSTKEINFKEPNPFPHVGINVSGLKNRDNNRLLIFETTITYITDQGLQLQGIFRKTPDKTKMLAKLEFLESSKGMAQLVNSSDLYDDPHQASGLLKLFLRELPESIIPRHHFDNLADPHNTVENLIFGVLDADSEKLFKLLALVAKNKEQNLMSAQALAVVFAPIVCGTDDIQKLQINIHNIIKNVSKIIEHFENILVQ